MNTIRLVIVAILIYNISLVLLAVDEKQTSFFYSGLVTKNTNEAIVWRAKDFAVAIANPNTYSASGNRVNGYIWTQTTLVSSDPNYVYEPYCENKNAQGQCIGTYKYPARLMTPYTQTERFVGVAQNTVGAGGAPFPSPFAQTPTPYSWSGTVEIASIEKAVPWDPNILTNIQPFYSYDPRLFSTIETTGSSAAAAFHAIWDPWSGNPPLYWDTGIARLVSPYANFYLRDNEWAKGWYTTITLTNGSAQSIAYTIENHLHGGGHSDSDSSPCDQLNHNQIETTVTIPSGQSQTVDVFRFHISDAVRSTHDTVLLSD